MLGTTPATVSHGSGLSPLKIRSPLAHRVVARPELFGEALVYQRHRRSGQAIAFRKDAPAQSMDIHHAKIIGADYQGGKGWAKLFVDGLSALQFIGELY
jgi:hypothetical protein